MKRDLAIDAVKGFLILRMVYAHNNASPEWILDIGHPTFIGSFLLISGFLTKDNFDLCRRLKGLIYPFFLFLAIGVIWYLSYAYVIQEKIDITDWAMDLVYGRDLRFNIPLWFLISLAEINLMKKCIDILRIPQILKIGLIIVLYLTGILLLDNGINYLYLSQSMIYLLFFTIGRWLRRHKYLLNHQTDAITSILIVTFLLIVRVNLLDGVIDSRGLFVRYISDSLIGLIIAYWIYAFMSKIGHKQFFCYFGKNSLVVMSMHILFLDFIWRIYWTFFWRA